jgi:hypothetical protein
MNSIPSSPNDPVNTDILMVAEDRFKSLIVYYDVDPM